VDVLWSRELAEFIQNQLKSKGVEIYTNFVEYGHRRTNSWKNALKEGIDAEILNLGANGWKKGKFRISFSLEFYPEGPEIEDALPSNEQEINQLQSPLDDIRELMNKLTDDQEGNL